MYELVVRQSFSAAHRIQYHDGPCENLHGHNYQVDVYVEAVTLDRSGLALDFGIVKAEAKKVLADLDEQYLNELPMFAGRNPSAEHIAVYVYGRLAAALNRPGVRVRKVSVWETAGQGATYIPDGAETSR